MKEIEGPAAILVAALEHRCYGLTDGIVGLDSCTAEIIEAPQDVVVPQGWEREVEPAFVDD